MAEAGDELKREDPVLKEGKDKSKDKEKGKEKDKEKGKKEKKSKGKKEGKVKKKEPSLKKAPLETEGEVLCKAAKTLLPEDFMGYAALVGKPRYVCAKCGRASWTRKNLCKPLPMGQVGKSLIPEGQAGEDPLDS